MTNLIIVSKLDRNSLSADVRADDDSEYYGLAFGGYKNIADRCWRCNNSGPKINALCRF